MGFFDFNVPYEPSLHQSSKTTRIKLVIKAMELGYIGIAYNHTIKGVMSDQDRCSIPLLSLSTLLAHAPSLSSSINLHRDLFNIPRSSPFRQYTRLTVCVENPAQSQALNAGNPVLKTYDLIAVRPLNQSAFDHACEKAEVNLIAIDFANKMPFRLKQSMVKAAMERGVYFEIAYSHLIADVQARRQVISNAKLLVDWTGGKNLIFTSAAPSVTELRGPLDVVNLSYLLGVSMERAKAAISKNCRNLITHALRRRHFYKEAVRIELIPSDGKSCSKESLSVDWLKWDPISSGEGDLQLDDMAKYFSATSMVAKSAKAIDFDSVIDSIESHGVNFLTTTKAIEVPVATSGVSEKPEGLDLLPESDQTSYNYSLKNQTTAHETCLELLPTEGQTAFTNSEGTGTLVNVIEEDSKTPMNVKDSNVSDVLTSSIETERHDLQSQKGNRSCEIKVMLSDDDVTHQSSDVDTGSDAALNVDAKIDVSPEGINLASEAEKPLTWQGSDVVLVAQDVAMDEEMMEIDIKDQEDAQVTKNVSGRQQLRESIDDTTTVAEHTPFPVPPDMKIEHASSVAKHEKLGVSMKEQESGYTDGKSVLVLEGNKVNKNCTSRSCASLEDVTVKGQKHEDADTQDNHPTSVSSLPGRFRAKQRRPHQPLLFPFKRRLNPMPLRSTKKVKRRTKMV